MPRWVDGVYEKMGGWVTPHQTYHPLNNPHHGSSICIFFKKKKLTFVIYIFLGDYTLNVVIPLKGFLDGNMLMVLL